MYFVSLDSRQMMLGEGGGGETKLEEERDECERCIEEKIR